MTTTQAPNDRLAAFSPRRPRMGVALLGAFLLLLGLITADVAMGPPEVRISPGEVVRSVLGHVPLLRALPVAPASPEADAIVWDLRLPRAVVAALIGMLLALAGVALQGLLMNPLADPYTVGVSSGAAVGAAIAEITGFSLLFYGLGAVGLAFLTAMGAVALVYMLARVGGRVSVQTFLLAGVVVGTLLWSLIPLFLYLAHRSNDLSRILFYMIGSVQAADWTRAMLLLPFAGLATSYLMLLSRELNLVSLGEETAAHLGVEIEAFKRRVVIVAALSTAAAVSVGGIIGFVGLVVPHLARRIVGPDHRALLPLAGLLGASLLVAADGAARVYLNELPVGVITSLIGAPVFCVLLRKRRAVAW
jgi:iron complex transport system permease protein